MTPMQIADGVAAMAQAIVDLRDTPSVKASFEIAEGDIDCFLRLQQLVTVWRDGGVDSLDLDLLAADCLARFLRWQ